MSKEGDWLGRLVEGWRVWDGRVVSFDRLIQSFDLRSTGIHG